MLSYMAIGLTAFVVSGLTFFSGFGLGTALMPVFALFFPLEIAIGATAVVHLANNLVKAAAVGRHADLRVTALFALPALPMAFAGAWLLDRLSEPVVLYSYTLAGAVMEITVFKLTLGALMAFFAVLELFGGLDNRTLPPRLIPLGGAISGFFGGLSGHQGAFRSMFLLKAGLSREAFIGTTVLSAILVDMARLAVYGASFLPRELSSMAESGVARHVLTGIVAAFLGVALGARLVKKVTLDFIRILVGTLLLLIAAALAGGVV